MYQECKMALNDILESKQKVFYKFTKSDKILSNAEVFKENTYLNYTNNSIVVSKNNYGLSFCISYDKLLACAGYGDVLTQIIIDKDMVLKENLEKDKYLYGYFQEYYLYGEIRAKRLHIGKQFSIANPSVLKEGMRLANKNSLDAFFNEASIFRI